jgi:hypothetical protein
MFIFKVVILLAVAVTIIGMLVNPILETLQVTSKKKTRSDKQLHLSGIPYVLTVPVRLYLRLNFMLKMPISHPLVLLKAKSTDGHKVKIQIRKSTLYIKPSWLKGARLGKGFIPLGPILPHKANNLSVQILEPNLVVKLNNNRFAKVHLPFNSFISSQVTFGQSKHTYGSPVCTITSFFIRDKLQDLTKAVSVLKPASKPASKAVSKGASKGSQKSVV